MIKSDINNKGNTVFLWWLLPIHLIHTNFSIHFPNRDIKRPH